jgi:hypothetical protein
LSSASPDGTLFIDRCAWSGALGRALTAAGIPFIAHHERFEPAAPDEQWLAAAAGSGWLVVTRDQRIRYKVNEQEAAVRAGLHLFVYTQGGLTAAHTAEILVSAYPRMLACAAGTPPPAFWSLQRSGLVTPLALRGR